MSDKVITIKDVAKLAGVSPATVSRVLNAPDTVKDLKREAVLNAMAVLKYKPNPIARALIGKKPGMVGVVVPNIINGAIAEIVNGVLQELEKNEFGLLLLTSSEDIKKEKQYLEILRDRLVDGAIFISSSGNEIDFSPLTDVMPVVTIDRFESQEIVSSIHIDELLGFRQIICRLKELGHREICYLAGDTNKISGRMRKNTVEQVFGEEGLSLPGDSIVSSEWTLEGGYNACKELLRRNINFTAIIAASDIVALGAMSALREENLRIPEDVSIIGYDNFPQGQFSAPPLSTLEYPARDMGQMAARIVVSRIKKPAYPPKQIIMPVKILERNSTAKAKKSEVL